MGPIIMPQIIAVVLPLYGVHGTLWLYTGLALVAALCSLLYQPVQWHVKKTNTDEQMISNMTRAIECDYCAMLRGKNKSVFSSQYLYNSDNANVTGYEIIDPATPMLPLANDGWSSRHSSSRNSLHSNRQSRLGSRITSSQNLVGSNRPSSANLTSHNKDRVQRKISEIKIEEHPEVDVNGCLKQPYDSLLTPVTPTAPSLPNQEGDNAPIKTPYRKKSQMNTFNIEKEVLKGASKKLEEYVKDNGKSNKKQRKPYSSYENFCTCNEIRRLHSDMKLSEAVIEPITGEEKKNFTLWQKIIVFFDLDLLRDLTYCNLMMGVTLGNFAELNFSILTPFVLDDWGFNKHQIATAMSLLGGVDISVRFFIPFIAGKIGWENKTFFLIGILGMAMGRICEQKIYHLKKKKHFLIYHSFFFFNFIDITMFQTYTHILLAFAWIGLGKGLRTVFMALVIPSYVPLDRLPAASGLQLVFAGLFYFIMGPIVGMYKYIVKVITILCYILVSKLFSFSFITIGLIRDRTNFIVTLHSLNIATFFVAICWIFEKIYRDRHEKKSARSAAQTQM